VLAEIVVLARAAVLEALAVDVSVGADLVGTEVVGAELVGPVVDNAGVAEVF
jgi:hypothetical protein